MDLKNPNIFFLNNDTSQHKKHNQDRQLTTVRKTENTH